MKIPGWLLTSLLACVFAVAAQAQGYPNKPVKFVVGYAAGGAVDLVARSVGQGLQTSMGQPFVVENKPGAGTNIAVKSVIDAPADGYTLMVAPPPPLSINVSLYPKLNYEPAKFVPITILSLVPNALMVHPSVPVNTVQELIAYAKANPGKLAFGHGSSGSLVSAAMLNELAGLQTINVPYKSIPPALTDLLGGQIQFAFADTGNAVAQMNGGRMRGLGVTTKKRAGKAPNVPSIGDTVKDYNVSAWFGLMAPAGIPADVQKKATATLMAVLAKPEVREKIQGVGIDLDVEDSATLAKTIDAEIKKWGGWVKTAGITPE